MPLTAAVGVLSVVLFLSTATAGGGPPPGASAAPSAPRPFDPRTDRLATDSTPQLNLVGRPGVVIPDLCRQRARSGFGGRPWTASCAPAPTTGVAKTSNVCPAPVSTSSPDPIWAHKVPIRSGKVDYPFSFTPGVIQVIHSPGCDLDALLRAYGLGAATRNLSGPFTDFDRAAGLDRSYRVQVAAGTEIATVLRLAPHAREFPYVGLFWIDPGTLH
jgi:hypothetical protein